MPMLLCVARTVGVVLLRQWWRTAIAASGFNVSAPSCSGVIRCFDLWCLGADSRFRCPPVAEASASEELVSHSELGCMPAFRLLVTSRAISFLQGS